MNGALASLASLPEVGGLSSPEYGMNGPAQSVGHAPARFGEGDDSLHRALSGDDGTWDVFRHKSSTGRTLRRSMTTSAMVMNQDSNAHFVETASGGLESLDYDEAENDTIKGKFHLSDSERRSLRRRELAITWVMVITTGLLVGSIGYASTVAVSRIVSWKFEVVDEALQRGAYFEGWLLLSAFVLVLGLIAVSLTRWAPEAAGSGIPHVKAYLNGNRLDGALRPRTLVAKVLGIICCVAIGMPAGREGPMVHTGAIVANLVGTGRSKWFNKMLKVCVCARARACVGVTGLGVCIIYVHAFVRTFVQHAGSALALSLLHSTRTHPHTRAHTITHVKAQ